MTYGASFGQSACVSCPQGQWALVTGQVACDKVERSHVLADACVYSDPDAIGDAQDAAVTLAGA